MRQTIAKIRDIASAHSRQNAPNSSMVPKWWFPKDDLDEYRQQSRETWGQMAAGWERRLDALETEVRRTRRECRPRGTMDQRQEDTA